MKKVLKWVGIAFLVLIVIGVLAGNDDSKDTDLGNGSIEQTTETTTTNENVTTEVTEEPEKPDLELLEHSIEKDEFTSYVVGTIVNNTDKEYGYVQIEINLLDADGAIIGSTLDNINNLSPGKKWKFKAPILEENATSYEIKGITGF